MTKYTVGRLVARCFPHVPHLPTHPVRLLQQRRILAAQLLVLLSLTCGDTSQVLPRASQAPPGDVLRAVAKGLSTDLVATPQGCSKTPEKSLEIPGIMAFLGGENVNFLQFGHLEQVALGCFWLLVSLGCPLQHTNDKIYKQQ